MLVSGMVLQKYLWLAMHSHLSWTKGLIHHQRYACTAGSECRKRAVKHVLAPRKKVHQLREAVPAGELASSSFYCQICWAAWHRAAQDSNHKIADFPWGKGWMSPSSEEIWTAIADPTECSGSHFAITASVRPSSSELGSNLYFEPCIYLISYLNHFGLSPS